MWNLCAAHAQCTNTRLELSTSNQQLARAVTLQVLDRSQTSINTPNTRERAAAKAAAEQSLLLEENWANLEHAKQVMHPKLERHRAPTDCALLLQCKVSLGFQRKNCHLKSYMVVCSYWRRFAVLIETLENADQSSTRSSGDFVPGL